MPQWQDDWLAPEHLARVIAELVEEDLDLVSMGSAYAERRGAPPYDPRPMVRILLYAYIIGVRSSRVIEGKCVEDVLFRWLAAGLAPDYRAIIRFRKAPPACALAPVRAGVAVVNGRSIPPTARSLPIGREISSLAAHRD